MSAQGLLLHEEAENIDLEEITVRGLRPLAGTGFSKEDESLRSIRRSIQRIITISVALCIRDMCDVSVNDNNGYLSALDLALKSFLDSRAPPFGHAETG